MGVLGPSDERRLAICEWLTANGIDPKTVPSYGIIRVVRRGSDSVIRYEVFSGLVREEREAPLIVEPPERWPA
ncbi:hypothetical protein [Streptomyces sp. NPDC048338]|uniref:hypothetical protein n=1 Tax=Streptomyces sp. NPDC048338 TaxID=3365536 RepID=UPI003711A065